MPLPASSWTRCTASCRRIRWSRWFSRRVGMDGCAGSRDARSADIVPQRTWAMRRLGSTDYVATWRAMQAFTDARTAGTPDDIWLTEHSAIYTLGLAGRREHVLRDNGVPVLKVDRGGQVTYHGPGQLIVYVLFDLRRARVGVRALVRRLESGVL